MDNKISHERILICIALLACACVIGYNAFFVPKVSVPTVVYTDKDIIDSNTEDEEYVPQTEKAQEVMNNVSDSNEDVSSGDSNQSGLININTASASELSENLPKIGKAIAGRIVEYRETNGNFNSIEEIMNVSGIGEKIFEGIKDKICV